jgi:hypothetical protein
MIIFVLSSIASQSASYIFRGERQVNARNRTKGLSGDFGADAGTPIIRVLQRFIQR